MVGAILGDIVGSVHGSTGTKTKDFPLFVPGSTFTDDSVLTVADWLLTGRDLAMKAIQLLDPGLAAVVDRFRRQYRLMSKDS